MQQSLTAYMDGESTDTEPEPDKDSTDANDETRDNTDHEDCASKEIEINATVVGDVGATDAPPMEELCDAVGIETFLRADLEYDARTGRLLVRVGRDAAVYDPRKGAVCAVENPSELDDEFETVPRKGPTATRVGWLDALVAKLLSNGLY